MWYAIKLRISQGFSGFAFGRYGRTRFHCLKIGTKEALGGVEAVDLVRDMRAVDEEDWDFYTWL